MSYKHLTAGEKYQIDALRGNGCTLREIGDQLGRDPGTISREIRRNRGERSYRPKQAQGKAESRSSAANTVKARTVLPKAWEAAQAMLRLDHSPEQVSGRLQLIDGARISHETIVNFHGSKTQFRFPNAYSHYLLVDGLVGPPQNAS